MTEIKELSGLPIYGFGNIENGQSETRCDMGQMPSGILFFHRRPWWLPHCAMCGGVMTKDSRISVAARNFVERFGDNAPVEAKRRAEELRSAGNDESAATWIQIYEEVKVLVERRSTTAH